jgi:MFS family permease
MHEVAVPLRHFPAYRRLWLGQTVSQIGSQCTALALPLFAALQLDATPAQMGLLAAMGTLPVAILSPFLGLWIDRQPHRLLLCAADIARALLLLLIPLGAAFGLLRLELLYAIVLGVGCLTALFDIACQAYVPTCLPAHKLPEGNSRLEVSRATAQVLGPALAGGLLQMFSAPLVILVDAASFLCSALCIGAAGAGSASRAKVRPPFWRVLGVGIRHGWNDPVLRALTGCTGTANFFGGALTTLLLLYATRVLTLTPGTLGIVFASGSIGTVGGAVIAPRVLRHVGIGNTLRLAPLVAGLSGLLILATAWWPSTAIAFLVSALALGGGGAQLYGIAQLTVRQRRIPPDLFGSVSGALRTVTVGTAPLGAILGGLIASHNGLWLALVLAVCGRLTAIVWIWPTPLLTPED